MASNIFGSYDTAQQVTVNSTQEVLGKKRFLNPDNEFEGVFVQPSIQANNTTISPTELSYLDGVTSNIQAQLANFLTVAQANTNYLGRLGTPTSLASVTTFNNGVVLGTSLTFPDTTVQTTAYTGGVNNTGVTTGAAASIPFLTNAASTIGQIVYTDSNGHFTYSPGTNTLRVGGTTNGAITVVGTASSLSVAGTGTAISTPNATAINFGTADVTGGSFSGNCNITNTNANADYYPVFVSGSGSRTLNADIDTGPFVINPSTGTFSLANTMKIGSVGRIGLGLGAGATNQGTYSVALGLGAGETNQGLEAVAIGYDAGNGDQGAYSFAFGSSAGLVSQGTYCFAMGTSAGEQNQEDYCVAIGTNAARNNQGTLSVAIGYNASSSNLVAQGSNSVSIGSNAGVAQGASSVAIGSSAGLSQGGNSVAIGAAAGSTQTGNNVAIGNSAGTTQGSASVAIGRQSGQSSDSNCVAIGATAGQTSQLAGGVALGFAAGKFNQASEAIAIGSNAGLGQTGGTIFQGAGAIAIGANAGQGAVSGQGANSIAIGKLAGSQNLAANSILLNASGATWNNTQTQAFVVNPCRNVQVASGMNPMYYNTTTGEISHSIPNYWVSATIITATVTLVAPLADFYFLNSAAATTITLPAPAVANAGIQMTFRRRTASNVGIAYLFNTVGSNMVPFNSATAGASFSLAATTQFTTTIVSDGGSWYQINTPQ